MWVGADGGKQQTSHIEPGVSTRRRVQVMLMRLLPIDNLL